MTGEDRPPDDWPSDSSVIARECDWDSAAPDPLSQQLVAAVADLEGCEPFELPPFFTAVDSEALDALFPPEGGGVERIRVRYYGYVIDVTPTMIELRRVD